MTKVVIETGETSGIPFDILVKYYKLRYNQDLFKIDSDFDGCYLAYDVDTRNYIRRHLDDKTRTDPIMINLVEHYKPERLKVISIPDDVEWEIDVPEGSSSEIIEEKHRTWS